MNETDRKLDEILKRQGRMESLLEHALAHLPSKKRGRPQLNRAPDCREDLTQERVETIERLFWHIVNAPHAKKLSAYKVPHALLSGISHPVTEAVVASVLLNQAALRNVFTRRGQNDPTGETSLECARRALNESNLIVREIGVTRFKGTGHTLIAMSPGEAERSLHSSQPLPPSYKGWTTTERARGFEGPEFWIKPHPEVCGQRVWDSGKLTLIADEFDEVVSVPAQLKIKPIINMKAFEDWDAYGHITENPHDTENEDEPDLEDNDDLLENERAAFDAEQEAERAALLVKEAPKPMKINVQIGPKK